MSGVVAGLVTLLKATSSVKAQVGERVYDRNAPQGIKADSHVVIHRMEEDHNLTLTDTGGLIFSEIDVDCKAGTAAKAEDVSVAVRELLKDYTGAAGDVTIEAVLLNDEADGYEKDEHSGDQGRYLTTLSMTIQYRT